MKRNTLIYIVSGILSVILLAYLLYNLDWAILKTAFSDLQWGWLGIALITYSVNILLRALRFSNLVYTRKVFWLELVPVAALHNILMYLLPAKTGDVAYIFLAKERLNLSLPEGTATLLAARFYDFSVTALFLAIILPFTGNEIPEWILQISLVYCLLVLISAAAILIFIRFSRSVAEETITIEKRTLFLRIRLAWNKFIAGLREIQAHGAHLRIALLTTLIWLCIYINFYSATRSMGLPVSFYHIVIISIIMIPLTLLPLQGFANIGTHEVGWTSVLVAFQYPYETALAIAAGSHLMLLMSVLISGGTTFFSARALLQGKSHETVV